jgi:pilus assembly protein Flp/PilA
MMNILRRLWKEEEGQGMVEYGLVIALISIVIIALSAVFQDGIKSVFDTIGNYLKGIKAPS